jgi:hypothetical protein
VRVGAAEAARVLRVALDLRRAAVVALYEHRQRAAGAGQAGGVERRLAGNRVTDLFVRNDAERQDFDLRPPTPG